MLTYIDRKYQLIQLDMPDWKAFDVVSYLGFGSDLYVFDELTARAKWRYRLKLCEVDFPLYQL